MPVAPIAVAPSYLGPLLPAIVCCTRCGGSLVPRSAFTRISFAIMFKWKKKAKENFCRASTARALGRPNLPRKTPCGFCQNNTPFCSLVTKNLGNPAHAACYSMNINFYCDCSLVPRSAIPRITFATRVFGGRPTGDHACA